MQEKEDIVVVGGYGHVGRTICEILEKKYPGKVFAAGEVLKKQRGSVNLLTAGSSH